MYQPFSQFPSSYNRLELPKPQEVRNICIITLVLDHSLSAYQFQNQAEIKERITRTNAHNANEEFTDEPAIDQMSKLHMLMNRNARCSPHDKPTYLYIIICISVYHSTRVVSTLGLSNQ